MVMIMSTCRMCGKFKLFMKLSADGLCPSCASLVYTAERQKRLSEQRDKERENRIAAIAQRQKSQISEFRSTLFPLSITVPAVKPLWSFWDTHCDHDSASQILRQKRALFQTIPVAIDSKRLTGTFISWNRENIYTTDLLSCTCPDHSERQLPCKHMYRLFYELNKEEHDYPISQIIDIPQIMSRLFTLNESQRKDFMFMARFMVKQGKDISANDNIKTAVEAGLYCKSEPRHYDALLQEMTKDEIILALTKKGYSGFVYSWTKVRLIDWVQTSCPQFLKKQFKNYCHIDLGPEVSEWIGAVEEISKKYELVLPEIPPLF